MGGRVPTRAVLIVLVLIIPIALATLPSAGAGRPAESPASGPGPHPAYIPFTPNVRVNNVNFGYDYQVEPTMAIDSKGRIFVGWKEAEFHYSGGQRVGFAYSTDAGDTFSANVLMNLSRLNLQSDPWLTVTADDRVYFTRIEYSSTSLPGGITVTNTTDGVTWGTDHFLDDTPAFADKESAAHDAAGNLYLVWNSDYTAYPIVFSRSNDGGRTWTPKVQISDTAQNIGAIVKVSPDGTVLATWSSRIGSNVLFDRSFDGGRTWGPDIRVNDIPGSAPRGPWTQPVLPSMVVATNGTIYIAWEDSRAGNIDVMASHSADGGTTWSPAVRLNDDGTAAHQWMPDLAIDPFGTVHAAWEDDRTGNHNIFYANSTDGGVTWGPNVRVTDAETPVTYTRPGDYLAIRSAPDGTVCVVWTDGRGGDLDIYFARLERFVGYHVDTVPSGLTVEVDGVSTSTPATYSWAVDSPHTISAPSPQAAGPQTRRVFDSWSDGGAQSHPVVAAAGGGSYVATFHTEHTVTVRTAPVPLSVLVDGTTYVGTTTQWWVEGTPHTVSAPVLQPIAAGERYAFRAWSDAGFADHTVVTFRPLELEAAYQQQFLLTVASPRGSPAGGGWFNATALASFSVDSEVAGTPGTRYRFAGWSGDSTAAAPSAALVMERPEDRHRGLADGVRAHGRERARRAHGGGVVHGGPHRDRVRRGPGHRRGHDVRVQGVDGGRHERLEPRVRLDGRTEVPDRGVGSAAALGRRAPGDAGGRVALVGPDRGGRDRDPAPRRLAASPAEGGRDPPAGRAARVSPSPLSAPQGIPPAEGDPMGICVSVEVEGEDLVGPVEERTDGKPLADFVASLWINEPAERLRHWGLPPWAAEVLRNVDATGYGEGDEDPPEGAWIDPARLKAALQVLRAWRGQTVRGNRRLQRELDDHHMEDEWFEPQDAEIEDGIARCDWAIARGKRVKLVAW